MHPPPTRSTPPPSPAHREAFEGLLLDWDAFTVRLDQRAIPRLPSILRDLAADPERLRAKREGLAREWTRLMWREALPADAARALRNAPDAFDSLMQTFWLRMQAGNLTGPLRIEQLARAGSSGRR